MYKNNDFNLIELDKAQLLKVDGGGPILEAIAWLYGFAQGAHERVARNTDWNDVDWQKTQVLVGG